MPAFPSLESAAMFGYHAQGQGVAQAPCLVDRRVCGSVLAQASEARRSKAARFLVVLQQYLEQWGNRSGRNDLLVVDALLCPSVAKPHNAHAACFCVEVDSSYKHLMSGAMPPALTIDRLLAGSLPPDRASVETTAAAYSRASAFVDDKHFTRGTMAPASTIATLLSADEARCHSAPAAYR